MWLIQYLVLFIISSINKLVKSNLLNYSFINDNNHFISD